MTEFGILRGMVDLKSYLDIDDLNGPGLRTYKKISSLPSVDYALFKINSYALSDSSSDRQRFVSELPNTIEELGPSAGGYIDPLLTSIKAEDCPEVQKELALQFPYIISSITQSPVLNKQSSKSYLEVTRTLSLSSNAEVSRAMIESIPLMIPFLHPSKVNNEIIGITISLILEKSREDQTQQALSLVGRISKSIGSDLTEKYFFREIHEIAQDSSVNIGKAVIELIADLFVLPHCESLQAKLVSLYINYMESDNWNIRKQSISFFPRVFKNCSRDMQDLFLPIFCKSLKDKSKWVKEQSINTCCCVIIYSKVTLPEVVIKHFLKVPDSGHFHAAFYFPGVLLTLGIGTWNELRKLFQKLSESDPRTKACLVKSIHEVGKIVGAEIAGKDLTEVFDRMIDDEDVKAVAFECLPNFLRELFPENRDRYKIIVKNLARDKDWRKRITLASGLCEYIGVFDYNCLYTDIWPLALELCEDQHSTVRQSAAKETAKLALYLLAKNSDWKRHIELSIKKYASGSVNSKIVFLTIVKHFSATEFAGDFLDQVVSLAKDEVKNVRIMCADAVNFCRNLENVWENARVILENDEEPDVRFEFGKTMKIGKDQTFVTPPIMRRIHNVEVGGVIKFSHSHPPKFAKIEDFEDIRELIN